MPVYSYLLNYINGLNVLMALPNATQMNNYVASIYSPLIQCFVPRLRLMARVGSQAMDSRADTFP